jgi:hypothetical protein
LGILTCPFLPANWSASKKAIYQRRVFFIRNLGFVKPTDALQISVEETVHIEKIHEARQFVNQILRGWNSTDFLTIDVLPSLKEGDCYEGS